MKKPYYTNCVVIGDNVLYRGIDKNGCRESEKIPYKPSLFVLSNTQSKYTTIDEKNVSKISFENISEARNFVEQYKEVDNYPIFGNTQYQYAFIADVTPEEIVLKYNPSNTNNWSGNVRRFYDFFQ